MEKDTNVIFRINSTLKENVTRIAKIERYTLSDVITAGLCAINKRGSIPINYYPFLPNRYAKQNEITISMIKFCVQQIIENNGKGLMRKAYLFGSYSRGDQKNSSDIDLRFEADRGINLNDIEGIKEELKNNLNKEIDLLVIDKDKLDPMFYQNIKKDEICIYER